MRALFIMRPEVASFAEQTKKEQTKKRFVDFQMEII